MPWYTLEMLVSVGGVKVSAGVLHTVRCTVSAVVEMCTIHSPIVPVYSPYTHVLHRDGRNSAHSQGLSAPIFRRRAVLVRGKMCAQGENKALATKSDRGTTTHHHHRHQSITTHSFLAHNRRSHVWMHCMDGVIACAH